MYSRTNTYTPTHQTTNPGRSRTIEATVSSHVSNEMIVDSSVHRAPILFYKPQTTLIGPEATIVVPKAAQPVQKHLPDYEVELTIVIGKPCKDVSEAEALDYVLGYTVGNDVRILPHAYGPHRSR